MWWIFDSLVISKRSRKEGRKEERRNKQRDEKEMKCNAPQVVRSLCRGDSVEEESRSDQDLELPCMTLHVRLSQQSCETRESFFLCHF